MKFTKLTVLALVLALLVCAFVACGGGAETETETDAETNAPGTETETETDGETEHVHDIEVQVEAATCSERGYEREVCKTCGDTVSVKPIPMTDHVAKEGTKCTEDTVCKFCETVMATAAGHAFGDATVTKEATCEAEGEKTQTCTVCNEKVTEVIAKLAHDVANPTDSKAATLDAAGYTKGQCTLCKKDVTVEIPAGLTDTFQGQTAGALAAATDISAGSELGSVFTVATKAGDLEIVDENGNLYLKKPGPNAQQRYVANGAFADAKTVTVAFDFRLDADCKATKGVISWINGGKEMRILNVNSNALQFGINDNGIIPIYALEVGKWITVKVVLNTETYDYEIYVDDAKVMYTTANPEVAGRHLVYVLENGEFVVKAAKSDDAIHNGADRSPFVPAGTEITEFYFWHWSKDFFCSLDNVTVAVAK